MKLKTDNVPANSTRGFFSLLSWIMIPAGSGLLWGYGGALLSLGVTFSVYVIIDEVVERITLRRRSDEP